MSEETRRSCTGCGAAVQMTPAGAARVARMEAATGSYSARVLCSDCVEAFAEVRTMKAGA